MHRAALRFVGLDALPKRIDRFDAETYFMLGKDDIVALAEAKFRGDRRLAVGLQIAHLRATGRLLNIKTSIPRLVLEQFGRVLGQSVPKIASLKGIYKDGTTTLYRHQEWVIKHTGFKDYSEDVEAELLPVLCAAAKGAASVDDLVLEGRNWLFARKVLIPVDRPLRDVARKAFADAEANALKVVVSAVPKDQLNQALRAVFAQVPDENVTRAFWLKQRSGKHSKSSVDEIQSRVNYLKTLGVDGWSLEPLTAEFQRAQAQSFAARPPSRSAKRIEKTQILEVVCFLRVTLGELLDQLLQMASRRVMDVHRKAQKKSEDARKQTHRSALRLVREFKEILEDNSRPADERILALKQLIATFDAEVAASDAQHVRQALVEDTGMVRTLMHQVTRIDFNGKSNDPALRQIERLKQLYEDKVTELPTDLGVKTHRVWQEFLNDGDRRKAMRAFEAATMVAWRTSLRRGSIWVDASRSFKDRDSLLIPMDDWTANRDHYLGLLGVNASPKEYINRLRAQIKAGLEAVEEACVKGAIGIDKDGLHLPEEDALDKPKEPERMREFLFGEVGLVQLPDLLIQADAMSGFSVALLGRKARDEKELSALYGAILALATGRTAKQIAKMIPGIEVAHVSNAMRAVEYPGRLRRANQCVLDLQANARLCRLYGDGSSGSADMMSLEASEHLWNARTDPRMRTWAVGSYTHVLDTWGVVYDQPIVLMERQGGPAVHGVQRYNDEIRGTKRLRLDILAVDTHGYTAVTMAVAKLLGFDLCPRIHSMSERKLYIPTKMDFSDLLRPVVEASVLERHIEAGWELLLRLAASIKIGRTTAQVALQRLGSAAYGDDLHRAGDALGKLLRTVYLCDYFTAPEFRREILMLLNRGESSHALERDLNRGLIRHDRGRRSDELEAISGSLALLTNIVIAWNMHAMDSARERLAKRNLVVGDDWIRLISPAAHSHINLDGLWSFSYRGYMDALLQKHAVNPRSRSSSGAA